MDTIFKSPLESQVLALCEKYLGPQGFRPVDVDCRMARRSLVRVFIERMRDGEPTSLDDCARVSQILGPVLDSEPMLTGPYDLEVSSPGLDRRLRTFLDFKKAIGETVRLKLVQSIIGIGGQPKGILRSVSDGKVVLEIDKKQSEISFENIKQANVIWKFE